jgi:hypothetical protein
MAPEKAPWAGIALDHIMGNPSNQERKRSVYRPPGRWQRPGIVVVQGGTTGQKATSRPASQPVHHFRRVGAGQDGPRGAIS